MNDNQNPRAIGIALEKRILNEFESKILNEERLSKVSDSRRATRLSAHSDMHFHCECDRADCTDTILLSTEEYRHVHHLTKHFIVTHAHVQLDIEEIVSSFPSYVLVAKFFPHAKVL